MRPELMTQIAAQERAGRYIYLACPWTPKGGGMYKVADYLLQSQALTRPAQAAELRPLDTRGNGSSVASLWVLTTALARLLRGRLNGQLAGVHVNMAERLSLFRKCSVIIASRALGLPVVLHLHAAQLHHFYRRLPGGLQALTRWSFSLADGCVVLGAASRRFVCEELGVPPERVEILINGVPEPGLARRLPDDSGQGLRQLLFVGNLSERKGVSDLLQAVARPDFDSRRVQLTLAGGGNIAGYQAQARALGIDGWVRFAGWSDQAQVAQLMARADLLVLPSYDEGLPLVILEALAQGVAVVCTPVGEIGSTLTDGEHACFVQPGDVAGLARALQALLEAPQQRQKLERQGQALYRAQFSMPRFFAGLARIHQRHFGTAAAARTASEAAPASSGSEPASATGSARPQAQAPGTGTGTGTGTSTESAA